MPFVPVDETVRVAITYQDTAGNEAVNVIHCRTDEVAVSIVGINDLLDAIEAWLNAWWDTFAVNQWTAVRLEARDLTSENSFYVSRTISVQGTGTDDALPPQDTVAISLRSPYSGRSRRGRLYHVGLGEGAQDGGYLSPIAITTAIQVYEELLAAIEGVNWFWVVVSYIENGVPRAQGLRTTITDIVITDALVDSMDKRKPN